MIHMTKELAEIMLSAGITLFVYIVRRDLKRIMR